MAKIIVTLDDHLIKVIQLNKERMTLGRRPYNDIVVDNLAVSGEHAALQSIGNDYYIEDLNSTNGTFINQKQIKRQILHSGDFINIGKYAIKYVDDSVDIKAEFSTSILQPEVSMPNASSVDEVQRFEHTKLAETYVAIKILTGVSEGREMPLVKVVTTIGRPSVAVVAITKRTRGYVVSHVEGTHRPKLNGIVFGINAVAIKNGDVFELAGTTMQFIEM